MLRITTKPARHSDVKPATCSDGSQDGHRLKRDVTTRSSAAGRSTSPSRL